MNVLLPHSAVLLAGVIAIAFKYPSTEHNSSAVAGLQSAIGSVPVASAEPQYSTQSSSFVGAFAEEMRRATERRDKAKERCFGIVGAAKSTCLADADQLFDVLMHRAEINNEETKLSVLTSTH